MQVSCIPPKPLWITTGCPCSIGPQVALRAVALARSQGVDCRIIGDFAQLTQLAPALGIEPRLLYPIQNSPTPNDPDQNAPPDGSIAVYQPIAPLAPTDRIPGNPTAASGIAQLAFIDAAVDLARKQAGAIVTGPVSKQVIATCGAPEAKGFRGHTEYIADKLGAPYPVMTFVADTFTTALVTTHLALRDVPDALTVDNVSHTIRACADLLTRLGKPLAKLLVAALNPHAGEHGLLGHEEHSVIAPAIDIARQTLANKHIHVHVSGPMAAESAFRLAMHGAYDAVVAMYHDQATIPMKLGYFGTAVNCTAGLPIVRTSVDHGTAYDIATQTTANPGSMLQAIALAHKLVNGITLRID